jgi:hypothetical protein
MKQIKTLLDHGWEVEMSKGNDGWFYASAHHGTWGNAHGNGESLNKAISTMHKAALELELTSYEKRE